ncbi:MAG: metallophosphoesterase [Bacilli bacterium]|nr:metallophosphoesterase [Bacilli bacterium]
MSQNYIQYLKIPKKRRIIVLSDIHGNYQGLVKLLKKVNYQKRDLLFIDGDIVEKGPESLKTLTFLMMLAKHNNVYFTQGNCDELFSRDFNDQSELETMYSYLFKMPNSLWWEMFKILDIKINSITDFKNAIPLVKEHFKVELDFLEKLPTIIDTPTLLFVHGGLDNTDISIINPKFCRKNDAFLECNTLVFPKWVIVGHWPVSNYGKGINCNPRVDSKHHVISVDGGNMIKKFGQINALIISGIEAFKMDFVSYEDSPTITIGHDQPSTHKQVPVNIGNNEMIILEPKGALTKVKQKSSGYVFTMPSSRLIEKDGIWYAIDYTDYLPSLKKGETVYCYEYYDGRYLVKKDGIVGWYEE